MLVWNKHETMSIEPALERLFSGIGKDKIVALFGRLPMNGLVLLHARDIFMCTIVNSS